MKKHLLLITLLMSMFWTTQAQGILIGDIMCVSGNDTTYVHPDEYVSGALAVVFYLDETGEHGWAIAIGTLVAPPTICGEGVLELTEPNHTNDDDHGWEIAADPEFNYPIAYTGQELNATYDEYIY